MFAMRSALRRLFWLAPLVLLGCAHALQAQTYTCVDNTETALGLQEYIVRLVTATDTAIVSDRTLYQLPATSASTVVLVTKKNVCNSAAAAYHDVLHPGEAPISRQQLVVIRVGSSRYVVADPTDLGPSEFVAVMVFDNNWNLLANFTS